jgi:hypothetical protein
MPSPLQPFLHHARAAAAAGALAVRAAIRSRVVAALLVLLAAVTLGLPRLIAGDGTPASDLQIRLRYTLGAAVAVLGLATLWAGCAAFGAEIDSRRFELTAVKPARRVTIWAGRWLGLVLLDAVLLAAVAAGACLQLRNVPAGLLLSRDVAAPELPAPEEEARRRYEELRRTGGLPADESAPAALRRLAQETRNQGVAIPPGSRVGWTFHLDRPLAAGGELWLRMRLDTVAETLADVRGVCRVQRADGGSGTAEAPVNDLARNLIEQRLAAPALAGARRVRVEFDYQAPPQAPALLVQPYRAVALLAPHGAFAGNLARALLAHLALLAALCALGLTLGACFSFPVAAFAATALLAVMLASADAPEPGEAALPDATGWRRHAERVSLVLVRGVNAALRPLLGPSPLANVAAGERVPAEALRRELLWGAGVCPLTLSLAAAAALRRRELARP